MSLISTIETDLDDAGTWLKDEVESLALDAWNIVKPLLINIAPAVTTELTSFIDNALSDLGIAAADILEGQNPGNVATAVLNKVEASGSAATQAVISSSGSAVLSTLTSLKALAASAVAATVGAGVDAVVSAAAGPVAGAVAGDVASSAANTAVNNL